MARIVRIPSQHYGSAVVQGLLEGHLGIHKFGQNADIGTASDPEDVWSYGGLYTDHFMAAPSTLYLSSDAAGDTSITVEVQYLDANWNIATVNGTTHASEGRTFVDLSVTANRVFRAIVTSGTPTGNLYISEDNTDVGGNGIPDTTTDIKAYIAAGDNQTLMAIYTIPANYTGYLLAWRAAMVSNVASSSAILSIYARPNGGVFAVKDRLKVSLSDNIDIHYGITESFAAKTDIVLRVDSVTNNSTNVSGGFDLLLVANTHVGQAAT